MIVHVGKVLRELYLNTGLKMGPFQKGVNFSSKTIYYHFKQADLNTAILDQYETGLRGMGINVDIWGLIAERRRQARGEAEPDPVPGVVDVVAEEVTGYGHPATVAELLRQAADLLEQQQNQEKQHRKG